MITRWTDLPLVKDVKLASPSSPSPNMKETEAKQQRIQEVEKLIQSFCDLHLNEQYRDYAFKLWGKLSRKRTFSVCGGKAEIWAASIVHVIARLNFLFDRNHKNFLKQGLICGHFGTNQKTITSKAAEIRKAAGIRNGDSDFCDRDIQDTFSCVLLPNGMLVPTEVARDMGLLED